MAPVVNQTDPKYTSNPTRPAVVKATVPEPTNEPRTILIFNRVDLAWLVTVNTDRHVGTSLNPKRSAGPMLARLPEWWLDDWADPIYVLIPTSEQAIDTLYADILVKHGVGSKYQVISEDRFKYNPELDTIYIANTDFTLNSSDVKDAMRSKATAFDLLQKIIHEKTDIFDLFFVVDSADLRVDVSVDDIPMPERHIAVDEQVPQEEDSTEEDS